MKIIGICLIIQSMILLAKDNDMIKHFISYFGESFKKIYLFVYIIIEISKDNNFFEFISSGHFDFFIISIALVIFNISFGLHKMSVLTDRQIDKTYQKTR